MGRIASFDEPKSIDEARARLIDTNLEIEKINIDMGQRFRYRDEDGMPMTPEEHLAWKKRAIAARNHFLREVAIVQTWIDGYERDVRAEEEADIRLRAVETQRRKAEADQARAEAKRARAEALYQRDRENNAWRERMMREHGTTKLPPDIARAEMIELEKLKLQVKEAEIARQGISHKRAEQKQRHKEWLRLLEIESPPDELDPMNLLGYAYRLLIRLRREGRVTFTDEEWAVISVIQERQIILNNLEDVI